MNRVELRGGGKRLHQGGRKWVESGAGGNRVELEAVESWQGGRGLNQEWWGTGLNWGLG